MRDTSFPARSSGLRDLTLSPCYLLLRGLVLVASLGAYAQQSATPAPTQTPDVVITFILHDTHGNPVSDLAIEVRSATLPQVRISEPTQPNGSITLHGLTAGEYDVTVAGGLLIPATRILISNASTTLVFKLPITLPQVEGGSDGTVSVEQLSVPQRVQETLRKAYEAWERKDLAQSRKLANRTLQLRPSFGPALSLLGMLELADGHPADAIVWLQQAVQYSPNSPRTYLALGSAYNALHCNTDALHALSIMAKLLPGNWQLHYELGRAHLAQGRYQMSIEEFNRAQQLAPQELMVLHLGKAHALVGLHNYSAARAELETVIRKSPNGPYFAQSRELAVVLDSHLKDPAKQPDATAHSSGPQRVVH